MFKNIFISFFVLVCSLFFQTIYASSIKVEDVFSDVNSDYKYLKELQELYDRGIIKPDRNGNFNPKELLSRDDFVGITMESTCSKCMQPGVDSDLINMYSTKKVFFDIDEYNKNFYCIADSKDKSFVVGYESGSICEDGTYIDGESPFCPNNTIILEEAIAIVLRASGIMKIEEAQSYYSKIASGEITEVLSDDVSPKNLDGSVYSFYPYFKKALEYEIVDVDSNGNTEIYTLVEVVDGKLRPKKALSKEDFLKIAYITLKASSCNNDVQNNNLSLMINIYDESCNEEKNNCSLSDLNSSNYIYDFGSKVETICESGVEKTDGYIWNFYNESNGDSIIKYGKYIDNFNFLDPGVWTIYLKVTDNCGNFGEVYNTLFIDKLLDSDIYSGIGVQAVGDKQTSDTYDFFAEVDGGEGPYKYEWDYGDGTIGEGEENTHIYKKPGIYEVKVKVIDSNGLVSESIIVVVVEKEEGDSGIGVQAVGDKQTSDTYDFFAEVDGGEGPYKYEWDYGDGTIGEGEENTHIYKKPGIYEVKVKVIDSNGLVSESIIVVVVDSDIDNNLLNSSIFADPLSGKGPFIVNFSGITSGGQGKYSYVWDFGDGNTGIGKNVENIFELVGVYKVKLTVTDSSLNISTSTILIEVIKGEGEILDTDGDGVYDDKDLCVLIKGSLKNNGCPILEDSCSNDSNCSEGFYCSQANICLASDIQNSCEYNGGSVIFGNAICNSCPCSFSFDFNSLLRTCDVIFPAITSSNSSSIYSRGSFFQIK